MTINDELKYQKNEETNKGIVRDTEGQSLWDSIIRILNERGVFSMQINSTINDELRYQKTEETNKGIVRDTEGQSLWDSSSGNLYERGLFGMLSSSTLITPEESQMYKQPFLFPIISKGYQGDQIYVKLRDSDTRLAHGDIKDNGKTLSFEEGLKYLKPGLELTGDFSIEPLFKSKENIPSDPVIESVRVSDLYSSTKNLLLDKLREKIKIQEKEKAEALAIKMKSRR